MQMILSSIVVLGFLILIHELGHFFAARLSGMKVLELAMGFGPKIIGWEKKGTKFSIRVFPLGGFCNILGLNPEEAKDPDGFAQKSPLKRAVVLASGSLMNLLLALILFFLIFFAFLGVADNESTVLGYILEDFPAEQAGLLAGDKLLAIDGEAVSNWDDIIAGISAKPNDEVTLSISRNGELRDISVVTKLVPETERAMIGIGQSRKKFSFFPSLQAGAAEFGGVIRSLSHVVTGKAPLDVAGPVGIFIVIGEVAQTGLINLIFLTAIISMSLGIMNLLPIPALDGGRLLFLLVETVRGKKIDPEKEGLIHFIGFAILILLVLFVTYYDLIRWNILPSN